MLKFNRITIFKKNYTMFKKIFISFFTISVMSFIVSCKKCKTCECTTVTSQTGMQDITQSFSTETCDEDEQNELQGTNTVYQGMPGFEQQITTTCNCQ